MPCAATALANSSVYYTGNKEPWGLISTSICIYLAELLHLF